MITPASQGFNIGYYIALASRRRWSIIVPFCLAMVVGIILAINLPKTYEATTLILVQPQRVPEKLVQPVVSGDIDSRISTISQQILSRSNLENVIERFKLFADPSHKDMFMEDKVASLRKRIKVEVSRGPKDADAFSISYRDNDPRATFRVANGLAAFFIDENLKDRETLALGTSDFLEAELETMRKRLEAREQDLKNYRQKFMGELPEQLDSNLKVLERLNQQLSQKEESLRSARVSLVALENEVTAKQNALDVAASMPEAAGRGRESEDRLSLSQLKEKLASLRATYTDLHPDVVRLKARVEKLEAELATQPPVTGSDQPPAAGRVPYSPSTEAVRQRTMLAGAIRTLEADIAGINKEVKEYQRRVEATPKREQELLSLKRDYDNIKASYSSLLNRKLEADIAVNMERKQKGEQFQIIDVARLPEKPVSPDLQRLFLIVIAAGLAVGAGIVLLLDQIDPSLRRLEDIEEGFGLTVLATVPRVSQHGDRLRHRARLAATMAAVVVALVLTAGLAMLVFNGVDPTLEWVRHYAIV